MAKKTVGSKHALCVGINDYPGTGSDLHGCVNDARDWKAALQGRGYTVTMLLDAAATKKGMVDALKGLLASGAAGSKLVFTYSGHGSWIPDTGGDEADARDEMLCPHDINAGAMLLDDELAELFGKKPAGSQLYFISDSCHSGTVARFAPLAAPIARLQPRPRFLPPATFLSAKKARALQSFSAPAKSAKQKYPALLAAGCKDTEYSYDANFGGRPNGAFTYFALRALAAGPTTPDRWMKRVRASLPTALHPQSPSLFGSKAAKLGSMF